MGAPEKSQNPREQVIQAIQTDNVELLYSSLCALDQALTGSDRGDFARRNRTEVMTALKTFIQEKKNEKVANQKFYLGDGGMSRIVLAFQKGEILLDITTNASERVKNNWQNLLP